MTGAPCSCRTTTSRCSGGCWPSGGPTCARCTSSTRRSPTRPCSACCPTMWRPSCSTAWRARHLRVPLPQVGGRSSAATRRRGARHRRRSWRRSGPTPARSGRRRRRRRPRWRAMRCDRWWAAAGRSCGRTAWNRRRTSCGGCSPSRSCDRAPGVARRGGARCAVVPQPAGAGGVSRLRGRRGAHGRAHQPGLRVGRMDADRVAGRRRSGALDSPPYRPTTCCWSTRCATG